MLIHVFSEAKSFVQSVRNFIAVTLVSAVFLTPNKTCFFFENLQVKSYKHGDYTKLFIASRTPFLATPVKNIVSKVKPSFQSTSIRNQQPS